MAHSPSRPGYEFLTQDPAQIRSYLSRMLGIIAAWCNRSALVEAIAACEDTASAREAVGALQMRLPLDARLGDLSGLVIRPDAEQVTTILEARLSRMTRGAHDDFLTQFAELSRQVAEAA